MSSEEQAIFYGSIEDPPAKTLLGVNQEWEGKHYVAGDEWHLEAVEPYVRNLGGGYLGVGADQAYILIGWSRPEFAWLIDYDALVVGVHQVHFIFFQEADTPEEFLSLWRKENRVTSQALLKEKLAGRGDSATILRIHRMYCGTVSRRFARLLKTMKIQFYLNDKGQYDYVRTLVINGRVRSMSADLLKKGGILGISEAARRLGTPIRTLYLSNAEEYWDYSQIFRQNLCCIVCDDKSVVVRTQSVYWINKDSLYNTQGLLDYQRYLGMAWIRRVYQIVPRKLSDESGNKYYVPVKQSAEEAEAVRTEHSK